MSDSERTNKRTGTDAVLETLKNEGTEVIFGYPGGATLPLYDKMEKYKIRHVLCRHEQGGAHMADGYARAAKKTGVCMATSGPGATNLVTGIATAFMDSSPVIAISGQVPREMIGNDAFQEVDITGITIPITKHNYLVSEPEALSESIHEAFYLSSTGRKGPVLIDIPKDVLTAKFKAPSKKHKPPALEGYSPTIKGHSGQIKKAVKLIQNSKRPLIISGGGVVGASAEEALTGLARKKGFPVAATLMGKNGFPNSDKLYLGMIGYHGTAAGNNAVQKADVIIAVGTRFGDRTTGPLRTFAPDAKIIHIDIDPAEISKNVPSFLPIVGDASYIINSINELLDDSPVKGSAKEWVEHLLQIKTKSTKPADSSKMNIPLILERLKKIVPDPIMTTDVGRHQIFAAHHFPVDRKNSFITSGGLGTMGFGLPSAIGAKAGSPDSTVVSINGDGSFLMCCQELVTAVEENLPVIAMVMKDQRLGMISQLQDAFYGKRYNYCDLGTVVDFTRVAEGMGALGIRAERPEDIDSAIEKAVESGRPAVIEFILHKQGNTYPMVTGESLTDFIEK